MIQSLDQEKCIGCGACMKSCPLDVFRIKLLGQLASPCAGACPIHNQIREWNSALQMGSVQNATAVAWKSNPLAAITGRVCPRFCESKCTRAQVDSPVNIGSLERFLGDRALQTPARPIGKKHVFPVAVIGSGPAGLACAAELAQEGFMVTVFDGNDEPGGMLRYGIPEYRLPPIVLARLLEKLRSMGISFKCGQRLGRDFNVEDLKDRGFGACFIAPGAGVAKKIGIEGGEGVLYGLDFLKAVRTRKIRKISGHVIVVGGGDVAMDTAQSLMILGASSVTVIALEKEGELPAFKHNIDDATGLGVKIMPASSLKKIERVQDKISAVEVIKCVSVFDGQGRFAPVMDAAKSTKLPADLVVLAIGQDCDLNGLPEEIIVKNRIATNPVTGQTAMPWIFAAGDAVTGPNSVASAIGGAKVCAQAMSIWLRGGDLQLLKPWDKPIAAALEKPEKHNIYARQEPGRHKEAGMSFHETYAGMGIDQSLTESQRCLTCGSIASITYPDDCMTCFACEIACPTEAIYVDPIKESWPRSLAPLPKDA